MKSIYKETKELIENTTKERKEAEKAGKDTSWYDGYLAALMDIDFWINANKREIETSAGDIFDAVNAEDYDL